MQGILQLAKPFSNLSNFGNINSSIRNISESLLMSPQDSVLPTNSLLPRPSLLPSPFLPSFTSPMSFLSQAPVPNFSTSPFLVPSSNALAQSSLAYSSESSIKRDLSGLTQSFSPISSLTPSTISTLFPFSPCTQSVSEMPRSSVISLLPQLQFNYPQPSLSSHSTPLIQLPHVPSTVNSIPTPDVSTDIKPIVPGGNFLL